MHASTTKRNSEHTRNPHEQCREEALNRLTFPKYRTEVAEKERKRAEHFTTNLLHVPWKLPEGSRNTRTRARTGKNPI